MATNYVQEGVLVDIVAPSDISGGDFVIIGDGLCGVAVADIATGETGAIETEKVYDLPKQAGLAISAGKPVYYDTAAEECDTTKTNVPIGTCIVAAATSDTTVRVKLYGAVVNADSNAAAQEASLYGTFVANDSAVITWVAPYALTIEGAVSHQDVQAADADGACTMALAGGGNNLLSTATIDMESQAADTVVTHTLTATTADLALAAGDKVQMTLTNDSAAIDTNSSVMAQIRYRRA